VVGVDVPFEEGSPDLVIESDKAAAEQSAKAIMDMLKRRSFIK
jgi:adenylylsulfate kinase-like enzyme